MDLGITKLKREDLVDNLAVIKINKSYKQGMSALELYEVTRGVWKRKIESVSKAQYCLSVAYGNVVEVYKIEQWYSAGTIPMQTRKIDSSNLDGRIEFVGHIAENEVRKRYLGKSVADLYKVGEADPVKVFLTETLDIVNVADINIAVEPVMIIDRNGRSFVICPNCGNEFSKAPRCPECGQLIKY